MTPVIRGRTSKFVMHEELLGAAIDHTIEERERIRKRCFSAPTTACTTRYGGGNVVYAYEAQTGFELTLREMKQIKRVESLARLRTITYKGQERSIAAHVKGRGRARGETLRVHFLIDYDECKLVIAHCGEHLVTYDTSSL